MGEALANPNIFEALSILTEPGLFGLRGYWEHLYHVDLIPYNPTDKIPGRYDKPEQKSIINFVKILKIKGINVTVRNQFGTGIGAACGQLYGSTE